VGKTWVLYFHVEHHKLSKTTGRNLLFPKVTKSLCNLSNFEIIRIPIRYNILL